jgi:hypothetical protein
MGDQGSFSVGRYTITIDQQQVSMHNDGGVTDCVHTVKGPDIDRLSVALGLPAGEDLEQHLRTLGQRDEQRLHTIFIENATTNFSWWDPDDLS